MAGRKVNTRNFSAQEQKPRETVRAALYSRVSTTNGQNPEMQLRELREYCQRRGWGIAKEYVDVGISGAKEKRPELDRLLADAHRRRLDAVVVWRFDRFCPISLSSAAARARITGRKIKKGAGSPQIISEEQKLAAVREKNSKKWCGLPCFETLRFSVKS